MLHMNDSLNDGHLPASLFQRASEMFERGQLDAALNAVVEGLRRQPHSAWGIVLQHKILKSSGDRSGAIECLREFIEHHSAHATEGIRALLVDQAAEQGMFDLAIEANDSRQIFCAHQSVRLAVAVQCFAKVGTLQRCLDALMKCRGAQDFTLFILQDALEGSKKPDVYERGHAQVRAAIAEALPALVDRFFAVSVLQNRVNMGTTGSCRRLLDHVAEHTSGFVFLEDDCILAPDALEWVGFHMDNTITPHEAMIGACESIFFDARKKTIRPDQREALTSVARRPEVRWAHTLQQFVPSTCFFTTSEIWDEISSIRGFPRGDFNLTHYMRQTGRSCIMPTVPRAADIGMLDEMGYSVNTLGRDAVAEVKNCYVMSLDEELDPTRMKLYEGHIGHLFDASVNLSDAAIEKLVAAL